MYWKHLILLLFIVFASSAILAQDDEKRVNKEEKDSTKNLKITALPIAFFLPETGFGFGGGGVSTFRMKGESKESRPSSIQLGLVYTTKKQILAFVPYDLYWNDEHWRIYGEIGFYKYFFNFSGIGIDSEVENLETYDVTFPRLRANLLRQVYPNIFVGAAYEFDVFYGVNFDEGGVLDESEVEGKSGGTVSNLGFLAAYDSRDHIFQPTKGWFVQSGVFRSLDFLGSTFSFSKFYLDARHYQQLKGKHILASNLYLASSSEGTPFFSYNYIGSKRTRGINDRRFQDLNEMSLTLEYRFPIYKRFGGVVFGSTGTVAPNIKGLTNSPYRSAAGIGLRYVANKKDGIRIRLDYGRSAEGGNFYITINEAF